MSSDDDHKHRSLDHDPAAGSDGQRDVVAAPSLSPRALYLQRTEPQRVMHATELAAYKAHFAAQEHHAYIHADDDDNIGLTVAPSSVTTQPTQAAAMTAYWRAKRAAHEAEEIWRPFQYQYKEDGRYHLRLTLVRIGYSPNGR